ncbi:MAG: hypothetical protein WB643_07715, partial [Candidatus Bathyarchaeia archaeon]
MGKTVGWKNHRSPSVSSRKIRTNTTVLGTFLPLVEAFLSEGYELCLIVRGLTVKKEFGCDFCGAGIVAWSPDDRHTILRLEKESDSIERKIKCGKCEKENTRHWVK